MFIKIILFVSLTAFAYGQVCMEDCDANYQSCFASAYPKDQATGGWTEMDKCQARYDECYNAVKAKRVQEQQNYWINPNQGPSGYGA